VRFLKRHHRRGEVPLLTLDIGANDVDGWGSAPNIVQCVAQGEMAIKRDLPRILRSLRRAGGHHLRCD
jgi:hypothetical protein